MILEVDVKLLLGWHTIRCLPWREDVTGHWQPTRHTSYDGDGKEILE